jgi:hypothetical protein
MSKEEGILYNYEIKNIFELLKLNKATTVCSKDELNKDYDNFVINLSNANEPGTHWVALVLNDKKKLAYYFDSFGLIYPKEVYDFCYDI